MTNPTFVIETGVSQAAAGSSAPAWVSGDPAGLAASASVLCLFDLGPNWRNYAEAQVVINPVTPSSGFSAVQMYSRDDASATANGSRRLNQRFNTSANGSSIFAALTTASGSQAFNVRPMGRYMVVALTNADATNAQGATAKVVVAIYGQ